MRDMSHFLLTRFNVPTPGREADIRARPGWLARRFDLFEQFCLPSVAAQSVQDFRWLIYFDRATPPDFRDRIAKLAGAARFEPIYRDALPLDAVIADIRARLPAAARSVLTTRLDNDDALARDFIARLQCAAVQGRIGQAFNFPNGYAWRAGWIYGAEDKSGPFASALESVADFQTIWARPHALLGEAFDLVQLPGDPAWLQIIHGDNVTNRIKGRRQPSAALGARFAIQPGDDVYVPGRGALLAENLIHYPLRQAREAGVRLIKPFLKIVR